MPSYRGTTLIIAFVAAAVLAGQLAAWRCLGRYSPNSALLAAEACLILALPVALKLQHLSARHALLLYPLPPGAALPVAVAALAFAPLLAQLSALWATALKQFSVAIPPAPWPPLLQINPSQDPQGALLVLFSVALVPAVCEELLFRGYALTSLRITHGPRTAVTASALLFALSHLDPWRLPVLLVLGVFLGLLTHYTRSVYSAILAHLLNNGIGCCWNAWCRSDPAAALVLDPAVHGAIPAGIALALAAVALGRLRALRPCTDTSSKAPKQAPRPSAETAGGAGR